MCVAHLIIKTESNAGRVLHFILWLKECGDNVNQNMGSYYKVELLHSKNPDTYE